MIDHLGLMVSTAAKKFKDNEALVFENQSFTFNEINYLVESFSSGLYSLGIREKDVVTLYASNCWEWIVSYFSIARVGAIINPVNTMLRPAEIKYVVNDCNAKAIITSGDKASEIINLKNDSKVTSIISFGTHPKGTISFEDLISKRNKPLDFPNVSPESLSTIAYTSGTTGHPKGAMQSHRAVILNGAI